MKKFTPPTQRERDKYRAAQEAGLLERVLEVGWAGLTAKESGRIGGLLAHKKQRVETMYDDFASVYDMLMDDFVMTHGARTI